MPEVDDIDETQEVPKRPTWRVLLEFGADRKVVADERKTFGSTLIFTNRDNASATSTRVAAFDDWVGVVPW